MVSCVDGSPDERAIREKTIYKCDLKNIRICVDGAFHDSVNLQIRRGRHFTTPDSFTVLLSSESKGFVI